MTARTGTRTISFPGRGRALRPTDLPICIGWWAADRITGLADAAAVSQWDDLVGTRHLLQGTGGAQPTFRTSVANDKPVVRLDGTDDFLAAASADVAVKHAVIVAKHTPATFPSYNGLLTGLVGQPLILVGTGDTGLRTNFLDDAPTTIYHKNGTLHGESGMTGPMEVFGIISMSAAAGWTITPQVGKDRGAAGRFWNGDVAELALFSDVLSTFDRQRLEKAWGLKYGLAVT